MPSSSKQQTRVKKYISRDGMVRASVIIANDLVKELCQVQETLPGASVFLGRTAIAAALLASNQKSGHRVGVEFKGSGPLKRVFVEAGYDGEVRAYCQNPAYMGISDQGELEVAKGIEEGQLTIEWTQPNQAQPYRGMVAIQTGEVGDDLAYYLFQSQQIPSLVSLGVQLDGEGRVATAGGVLIELMPGHSEDTILTIEENSLRAPAVTQAIEAGADERTLIEFYLRGLELLELPHEPLVRHKCRCSRERVLRSMTLFSTQEIQEMIMADHSLPVVCEFCKEKYDITVEDLTRLLPMQ